MSAKANIKAIRDIEDLALEAAANLVLKRFADPEWNRFKFNLHNASFHIAEEIRQLKCQI